MGAGKTTVAQILKEEYGYRETAIGQMVKIITHSLHRAVLCGEAERYTVNYQLPWVNIILFL